MASPDPYHKLQDKDKEIVRIALGYTPNKRDSKQFAVREVDRSMFTVGHAQISVPWIRYHVYMYEHRHEYICYSIVEDHGTHWRKRGDSRYDEWETISKQ